MLETVLLSTLTPAAYLSGLLVTARLYYQKARPSKVPLCGLEEGDEEAMGGYSHEHSCYRRYSTVDTEAEAVSNGLLLGMLWPAVALFLGAQAAIMAGAPEFPEEKAARLKSRDERIDALEKEGREIG